MYRIGFKILLERKKRMLLIFTIVGNIGTARDSAMANDVTIVPSRVELHAASFHVESRIGTINSRQKIRKFDDSTIRRNDKMTI